MRHSRHRPGEGDVVKEVLEKNQTHNDVDEEQEEEEEEDNDAEDGDDVEDDEEMDGDDDDHDEDEDEDENGNEGCLSMSDFVGNVWLLTKLFSQSSDLTRTRPP